ncbi:MAG TPA: AI-2E family transporter [Thermoleophilia bacterium]|nr:AI-2E family transporter [Thermoleophilia bacterium]
MPADKEASQGHIEIPRWVQLGTLPVILLVAWFMIGLVGEAVFVFLTAMLIALVLNPLVRGLQRVGIPRAIGVFLVYLGFVAVIALIAALLVPPAVSQLLNLLDTLPGLVEGARSTIDNLQRLSDRLRLDIDVNAEAAKIAQSLSDNLPSATRSLVSFGVSLVRGITITIIIVVVSIYMLLDAKRIVGFITSHFPTRSQEDGEQYVTVVQRAVVNYVKAQLLLSGALGLSAGLAMWLLGVTGVFPSGSKYAVFFGVWTAIMEVIPYVGPVMAAVPPTIVALFHSPLAALWVIVAFLLIQQVEGHILAPLIMSSRFRVHPLIVIFVILAGAQIHGVTGAFLAIPLIPMVKESISFFSSRVSFEGWRRESAEPPAVAAASPDEADELP